MRIAFSGAEVAAHRTLLLGEGVNVMALNLSAYFKQRQPPIIRDAYDGLDMVLYTSEGGLDPMRVGEFIEANGDRFETISGIACDREHFAPEWLGGNVRDFYRLTESHERIGVAEGVALNPTLMQPIAAYVRKRGIDLFVSSSKADVLSFPIWHTAINGQWISASRYRELQVWDGGHVARYPKDRRMDGIERHATQITNLGGDLEAIRADDSEANTRLAVRSWLQYERVKSNVVAIDSRLPLAGVVHEDTGAIAIAPLPMAQRERVTLPLLVPPAPDPEADADAPVGPPVLSQHPMRTCDSCYLSAMCPAYEANSSCAFAIPVTIRTKSDIQSVMSSLLEMQVQRVFMARFAEDLLSQGVDPTVSAELERMMRMFESVRKITDDRVSLTVEAHGSAGALSRLFGERVGAAQQQLTEPIPSGTLMEAILDADEVEPD